MPIVHKCDQGSELWFTKRLGIPTASCFHKVLTTKKLEPSAQRYDYMALLLAEWALGRPCEVFAGNRATEHGEELEPIACKVYEFEREVEARTVGFITTDDGMIGASPDRLIGEDGLLELKCPFSAAVHMCYMMSRNVDEEYMCQLQGQLFVSRRSWVDIQSYFPGLPSVIIRVEPIERYQLAMGKHLPQFVYELLEMRAELTRQYGDFRQRKPPAQPDPLGLSEEDLEVILQGRKEARAVDTQ